MELLLLIVVPLLGALAAVVLGRTLPRARLAGLLTTGATLILAVRVWSVYAASGEALEFTLSDGPPLSVLRLAADGLAVPLVMLTALLSVIAVLASWNIARPAAHVSLLLALEAAVIAVFLAADLVLFYVAWEAVLIPMFFLIGVWGHENRRYAAMKFFIYTFVGSALMLIGLIALIVAQGGDTAMGSGGALTGTQGRIVYWLLAAGFLVKVPVVPLHTWLPDAHVEAPTAGSVMLAGVLLKMGAYGMARVSIPAVPEAFTTYAPVLAAFGVVGIVYGAAMALGQSDLKRLVAYSSVAHMGFVLLGLASGSELGLSGAMLGMVSHGIVSGLLFFLVGALQDRAHTRDMSAFGGLGQELPRWATVFVVASLASLGLPGLSGFPGEFATVLASFERWGWWLAVAGVGIVLAAAYSLRAVRTVVHGEPRDIGPMRDLGVYELAAVVPLVMLTAILGIWPRLVTDLSAATLAALSAVLGTVD